MEQVEGFDKAELLRPEGWRRPGSVFCFVSLTRKHPVTPVVILCKHTEFRGFMWGAGMVERRWTLELTRSLKPKNVFFYFKWLWGFCLTFLSFT